MTPFLGCFGEINTFTGLLISITKLSSDLAFLLPLELNAEHA